MTLDEQLVKTSMKYKRYFRWKFKLTSRGRVYNDRPLEEIMKIDGVKNKETYYIWETTDEYKHLVDLYIMSHAANDLLEIYTVMLNKAKKGDSKAIDTIIKLQKSITQDIKGNSHNINTVVVAQDDEDDGLEL